MEVRIEKRTFSEWFNVTHPTLQDKVKIHALWIVFVNGRRVDSFMKKRNAVAKARRLRCGNG